MNDTEARIANLAQKLNLKFMVRKELKKLPAMLHEHERVANLAQGRYEGNEGLIVATDRRVMFIDEGLVRSHREDFPYERVSSVQTSTSMMSGKLVIFASGNKAQLENIMPKQQATALADHIRHQIAGGPAAPATAAAAASEPRPAPTDDPFEKLRKLGELRDAGIISPEEFEAKKASIIDAI
jgi:hypothetical protein